MKMIPSKIRPKFGIKSNKKKSVKVIYLLVFMEHMNLN